VRRPAWTANAARAADAALLTACLLWGVSFVVAKLALGHATPFAFTAIRFAVASVVLAPFARLHRPFTRVELVGGGGLALLLGIGFLAQMVGLVWTTPSRSAFLVALSSVVAPALAVVALRERPRPLLLGALAIAALGVYWLLAPERGGVNRGDLLTLVTAVLYGGQIVAITAVARRGDPLHLAWLEIAGTALLAGIGTLLFEAPRVAWTPAFGGELAYTALLATVATLLLQLGAQRHMSSTRAAILFTSESMFAAATSWLVLRERLSATQWLGAALILVAVVLVELPGSRQRSAVSGQRADSG
jgi:drug/metabolite transporter (DMT)-like permease